MKQLPHYLAALLAVAWVGSLWAIGYLAVPVLFYAQPDRQLAGMLAGHMFALTAYLGMLCGAYLLLHRASLSGRPAFRDPLFWTVAAMLSISLLLKFGFQPVMDGLKQQALPLDVMHSALAGRFRMLHGLSSIAYLIQSLLGVFLVVGSSRSDRGTA